MNSMINRSLLSGVLASAIFLVACAPATQRIKVADAAVAAEAEKQQEIALDALMKKQIRLSRLAFPLLVQASALCKDDVTGRLGAFFANKHIFPDHLQDAAVRLYNLGDTVRIVYVHEAAPASAAGLAVGDILISVGAKSVPTGKGAIKKLYALLDAELHPGKPVSLVVLRDGERIEQRITPVAACNYPVLLSENDSVNAFADGKRVVVTKGMIRFVENDRELSLVIAHELAHNAMGHMDAKMGSYALGSILDIIAAAYGVNTQGGFGKVASQAYSQDYEAEADYVGLYIMARADMDIDDAANFWRRLAAEHPGSIRSSHLSSHPATPQRFVEIEATVREIDAKRLAGESLMPTLKARRSEPARKAAESGAGEDLW